MTKIYAKAYVKIGDYECEIGELKKAVKNGKGKPITMDGKKIGTIIDINYEDGEINYVGELDTDKLPNMEFFYKRKKKE